MRGGAELRERVARPRGLAARQVDIEPPEGQGALARGEDDVGSVLRVSPSVSARL